MLIILVLVPPVTSDTYGDPRGKLENNRLNAYISGAIKLNDLGALGEENPPTALSATLTAKSILVANFTNLKKFGDRLLKNRDSGVQECIKRTIGANLYY